MLILKLTNYTVDTEICLGLVTYNHNTVTGQGIFFIVRNEIFIC
jgi:hypothetical protein